MISTSKILRPLQRRTMTAVMALPTVYPRTAAVSIHARFGLAMSLAGIGIAAIAVYIAAVNSMLVRGEAIKEDRTTLRALMREHAELANLAAKRHSPLWLKEHSRLSGMVEVGEVRYLITAPSIARSH